MDRGQKLKDATAAHYNQHSLWAGSLMSSTLSKLMSDMLEGRAAI